jgi:hypothetical protein
VLYCSHLLAALQLVDWASLMVFVAVVMHLVSFPFGCLTGHQLLYAYDVLVPSVSHVPQLDVPCISGGGVAV